MKTTEPTTNKVVVTCRLRNHVITDEGDFVPAGTPVKVMGWLGNGMTDDDLTDDERAEMVKNPRLTVRAAAYVYSDCFDYDSGRAATGRGLYLTVEPSNLVYDDSWEC